MYIVNWACLNTLLELLTALLEYLNLFTEISNYNNDYQCGGNKCMQAGDRKQGINKCWLYTSILDTGLIVTNNTELFMQWIGY